MLKCLFVATSLAGCVVSSSGQGGSTTMPTGPTSGSSNPRPSAGEIAPQTVVTIEGKIRSWQPFPGAELTLEVGSDSNPAKTGLTATIGSDGGFRFSAPSNDAMSKYLIPFADAFGCTDVINKMRKTGVAMATLSIYNPAGVRTGKLHQSATAVTRYVYADSATAATGKCGANELAIALVAGWNVVSVQPNGNGSNYSSAPAAGDWSYRAENSPGLVK